MKKKLGLIGLVGLFGIGVATTSVCLLKQEEQHAIVAYAEAEEETQEQATEEQPTQPVIISEVKDWVKEWFSPDKIAMYISWVAYIGTIIGLVVKLKQLKQSNNLTLQNVSSEIRKVVAKEISEKVAEKFDAVIPSLLQTQEKTNAIMTIFAKILALSQENTPESRVAILNLIEELGAVSKETIDTAKEVIEKSIELAEETKKELDKKIDEIVESYDGTSI